MYPQQPNEMMLTPEQIERIRAKQKEDNMKLEYFRNIQQNIESPFAKTQEQKDFLNFLSGQVYNEQPSAGGAYFQQNQNQNLSNLGGAIGSSKGVNNPALAASRLSQIAGNIGQQGVSDTSAFRLKEEGANLARRNLLSSALAAQNKPGQDLANLRADAALGNINRDTQASIAAQDRYQQASLAQANRQMQLMGGIGQMAVTLGSSGALGGSSPSGTTTKSLSSMGDKSLNSSAMAPGTINKSTGMSGDQRERPNPSGLQPVPSDILENLPVEGTRFSPYGQPLDPIQIGANGNPFNSEQTPWGDLNSFGPYGQNVYSNQDIYEQAFLTSPEQKENLYSNLLNAAKSSSAQASEESLANTQKNIQGITGTLGSTRGVNNAAMLSRQAKNIGTNLSQQGMNQADIARSQAAGTDIEKQRLAGAGVMSQYAGEQDLARLRTNINTQRANAASSETQARLNREQTEDDANAAQQQQTYSTMASLAMMAAMAASDVNVKKNIEPGSEETKNFLDLQYRKMMNELTPYSYDYKDDKYGSGPQLGVMAQDLEKSPIGKQMVGESKDGTKMIVPNVSTILGAQANLNERLNKLEGQGMNETSQEYLDFLASQQNQPMGQAPITFPPLDLVGTVPGQGIQSPSINQAPRMQKIVPSPMPAPAKIPSTPVTANKIKSVPGQAPAKIPSAPVKAKKIDSSEQKLNKIQSMVEDQKRMQYLDFLMKRYNDTTNAFTKKYV